mgnify:CR=1 FL=1
MATVPVSILGIAGSPRVGGNTDTLLHEALRGAAEAGARTEFLAARSLVMRPCIECDRCQATGRCAINDDAQAVHQKLLAADHLVFATPIFFAAVTAQAKILIDRCQCFWSLKYIMKKPLFDPPRPHRTGLWLACCGFPKRWMFDGPRRTIKALFNVLEFAYGAELCYSGIDARGDITRHPTALAEARQAGRALALGHTHEQSP